MKKILLLMLLAFITSCSSSPRKPSSTIFTCHFKSKIDGIVKHFEFVSDDHSLLVDKSDVAFEENDFASGVYVYKTTKNEKNWVGELVFTSYEKNPQVYLKLSKSPLSLSEVIVNKACE